MKKKPCYGSHYNARCYALLKQIAKAKDDGIKQRVGKNQMWIIELFARYDTEPSSCHKSWKWQTKKKKQYEKF